MANKAKATLLKAERAYNKVADAYIKAKMAYHKAEEAYAKATSTWQEAVRDYEKHRAERTLGGMANKTVQPQCVVCKENWWHTSWTRLRGVLFGVFRKNIQ